MKNKYNMLVEEINKQEEIAEQKDNLAEQLSQVTDNVNKVKDCIDKLEKVIADMQEMTTAVTAASKSTDSALNAITQAILDSRKVVVTNKLDDASVRQLRHEYSEFSKKEEELFKKHYNDTAKLLEQNKDRCYEIINKGNGVYLGKKIFIRLFVTFCVCFGIVAIEIVYGLIKWLGL